MNPLVNTCILRHFEGGLQSHNDDVEDDTLNWLKTSVTMGNHKINHLDAFILTTCNLLLQTTIKIRGRKFRLVVIK